MKANGRVNKKDTVQIPLHQAKICQNALTRKCRQWVPRWSRARGWNAPRRCHCAISQNHVTSAWISGATDAMRIFLRGILSNSSGSTCTHIIPRQHSQPCHTSDPMLWIVREPSESNSHKQLSTYCWQFLCFAVHFVIQDYWRNTKPWKKVSSPVRGGNKKPGKSHGLVNTLLLVRLRLRWVRDLPCLLLLGMKSWRTEPKRSNKSLKAIHNIIIYNYII